MIKSFDCLRNSHSFFSNLSRIFFSFSIVITLVLSSFTANASIKGTAYHFLDPKWVGATVVFHAHMDGTKVQIEGATYNLDKGESGSHVVTSQGSKITAQQSISVGTETSGLDIPVPFEFKGKEFLIPEQRTLYLMSYFNTDTIVQVSHQNSTTTLTLTAGQVYTYVPTENTTHILSDQDILVSADKSYPVPPVSNSVYGVVSNTVRTTYSEQNTLGSAVDSFGLTTDLLISSPLQQQQITQGASSNGKGRALQITADSPVGASQSNDSFGLESTAFWPESYFAKEYIIPVDATYLAVVCNTPNTEIKLYTSANQLLETLTCQGSATKPGKAYHDPSPGGGGGVSSSARSAQTGEGSNTAKDIGFITEFLIQAGTRVEASEEIYLIYNTATTNAETNLVGYNPPSQTGSLFSISFPGSDEQRPVRIDEPFVAKLTAPFQVMFLIQNVDFSLDGVTWFTATRLIDGWEYDFGLLTVGDYSLYTRLDGVQQAEVIPFSVEDPSINIPPQITDITLPPNALVNTDVSVSWDAVTEADNYKVFVDNVELQTVDQPQTTLTFDELGNFDVQVSACNSDGCGELSPARPITVYFDGINFNDYTLGSYGGTQEDVSGTTEILDGGLGLKLEGNTWKQIPYEYTVSVNTIVQFEFASTEQGEIHGIGLDTDLNASPDMAFQLYGLEECCLVDFKDYDGTGAVKQYEIMIGQYYQGEFSHLFFIMDDDRTGQGTANSTFSSIRFFEEQRVPDAITGLQVASSAGVNQNTSVTWDSVAEATHYQLLVNDQVSQTVSQNNASVSFGQLGNYFISVKACNAFGCSMPGGSQLLQILPPPAKTTQLQLTTQTIVTGLEFGLTWAHLNDATTYKLYIDGVAQPQEYALPSASLNIALAGQYVLQVQACNPFGCGELSDNLNLDVIGQPGAVSNLSILSIAATKASIAVAWSSVATADYYEVAADGRVLISPESTTTELSFAAAGVYAISVRACNLAGCGNFSPSTTVTTIDIPTTVVGVEAPANGRVGENLQISWAATPGATTYKVRLDNTDNGEVNVTQKSVSIDTEGGHVVEIAACNQVGCGPYSTPLGFTVSPNLGPVAMDATIQVTQQNQIVVQDLALLVTDANGIDWSTLSVVEPELGNIEVVESVVTFNYNGVHLDDLERFEYQVMDSLGVPSNVGFITLDVSVLQVPALPSQLLIAELAMSEDLALSWQGESGDDIRYYVEHQRNDNPWQLVQEETSDLQVPLIQPLNGVHRFRVRACKITHNLCSEFAQSTDLTLDRVPSPVDDLLPPEISSSGQIRLQWIASYNAEFYNIEQQIDQAAWTPLQQDLNGTLLMVNTDGNGQYRYRIYACNGSGCSMPTESPIAEIANKPNAPGIVNLVSQQGQVQLNWSQVDYADWFNVENLVSATWQGVNGNAANHQYAATSIVLSPVPAGSIRVKACNSIGCSPATIATLSEQSDSPINQFFADQSVLAGAGFETSLHWEVLGAADVSIASDQGESYTNLPSNGSIMVMPGISSRYTLSARFQADDVLVYSQNLDIVVSEAENGNVAVLPSDPTIAPIVSSMLVDSTGSRWFGDLQGALSNIDGDGNLIWRKYEVGLIYSPPVEVGQTLFFTATSDSGDGKFCQIGRNGSSLECILLAQPLVGAPVMEAESALVVDLYGGVYSIDLTTDAVTSVAQLPAGTQVRSTPQLTPQNTLIVRSTDSDIFMLDLNNAGQIGWVRSTAGGQQ